MNYDGVIFGNGMSLNLLQQLKSLVCKDKQYLLDINDFLKFWIKGNILQREEKIIYTSLYENRKDKWKFFEELKSKVALYYETYDTDIEYTFRALSFKESEYWEWLLRFLS